MKILTSLCALAALVTVPLSPAAAKSWHLTTLYNFCNQDNCADGSFPLAGLVRDAEGNLFGTTETGGTDNDGVVFELEKHGKTWKYGVLHSFCFSCGDGVFPAASLIVDVNGDVYGSAQAGGAHDCGIVYRIVPSTKKMDVLHTFCADTGDGDEPSAALSYSGKSSGALYDGISPLYGVTDRGGATGGGTVYELQPKRGKWTERVLYSFCADGSDCADGWTPSGELLVDSSGSLFGNTSLGGITRLGGGVTFELTSVGKKWRESVLYSFCPSDCSDGQGPTGALVMDTDGALLGTVESTGTENGAIFKLTHQKKGWSETLVHTFCSPPDCTDGYQPDGGLIADASGNIYGTDELGGAGADGVGGGTAFRLTGTKLTTLYPFCSLPNCSDGRVPMGTLITDPKGTLYGVNSQGGGDSGSGTVFQLTP